MPNLRIFGGKIYNNQAYKDYMNSFYYPAANMQKSVAALRGSGQIDITTMEFGQYQPILSPPSAWPGGGGQYWTQLMGRARVELSAQANTAALANDEPGVIPLTRCALLDASIRKCFNSNPPIPYMMDIMEQPADGPNAKVHEVQLVWEYGKDGVPTLLKLTMICPPATF